MVVEEASEEVGGAALAEGLEEVSGAVVVLVEESVTVVEDLVGVEALEGALVEVPESATTVVLLALLLTTLK